MATVLEPLAGLADEVVLAVDRSALSGREAAYGALADRVLPIDFEYLERHLEVVHAACAGAWILRIDSDEVASRALVEALPVMLAREDVAQYGIPRRWLTPDGSALLDEPPWWPDFQVRLVRNDERLAFSGAMHSGPEPVQPLVHVSAPMYHLDCALQAREARLDKATVYEILRPGLRAPGGAPMTSYYDPERFASAGPASVPEEDRPHLAEALASARAPCPAFARTEPPPPTSGAAEEAGIAALERLGTFAADEGRWVSFVVTNRTAETWPAGPEARFLLGHRWLLPGGDEVPGAHGVLPVPLDPGGSAVVPMYVKAPACGGRVELLVDVVDSHRRWVGATVAFPLDLQPANELPDRREAVPMRRAARRLLRRRRQPTIPKVLHRVWLGGGRPPREHDGYWESWRERHPRWELRTWTDDDAPALPWSRRARNLAERADLVRYEIVRRHGGVYVDTDVECLRPVDELLDGVVSFAGYEVPGRLCNAVIGAVAGHRSFERAVALTERTVGRGVYPSATATDFLTCVLEAEPEATLFGPERFYPYLWDEEPRASYGEDVFAVHHWAKAWKTG